MGIETKPHKTENIGSSLLIDVGKSHFTELPIDESRRQVCSVRIPLMVIRSERSDAGVFIIPEVIGMGQG